MKLLSPLDLGPLRLPNRVVMAPLTRSRHAETIPNRLTPAYYAQRASGGLLIAEATQVDPRGQGYPDTPGIYSDEHVAAWREVTDLVHAVGGRIVLQLWHVGRVSHSSYHDGALPVAPTALPATGKAMTPDFQFVDFETPHALTVEEIADIVAQFGRGARLAREAGFDGVEIHGANGYLIEQFLSSGSNQRTDEYGGSPAKRVRFLDEVMDAVLAEWDAKRVGIRLSFGQGANGVFDDHPEETFGLALRHVRDAGFGYVHAMRPNTHTGTAETGEPLDVLALTRANYDGVVMSNGEYGLEDAERDLQDGRTDLIAYGRPFLANPDLPIRFAAQSAGLDAPLNEPDSSTFYGGGAEGYTDYPLWPALGVSLRAEAEEVA